LIPASDCLIPCWWGIDVGQTPWSQAKHSLGVFASEILDWRTISAEEPDGSHMISTYYVYYAVRGLPRGGGMAITTRDGIIDTLLVNTDSTPKGLSLSEVLGRYGRPSSVLVRTFRDRTPFGLPFLLVLLYQDRRFMARYEIEAVRVGDNIVACPADTPPAITIWGPHKTWSDEDLQTYLLGPDYYNPLIPLADSTDFTVDSLYEASEREGEALCLRSPSSIW